MKTQFLVSALVALSLTAFAGNEGPQATPPMPPTVIAEYDANGGFFVPPNAPSAYHYQILTNRKAVRTTYFRSSEAPKTDVIKTLNDTEFKRLTFLVGKVKPGAVYDPHPDQPGCEDAPSFKFLVNTTVGTIVLSETIACKTTKRRNESAADREIIEILKGLEELSSGK